MSTKEIQDSIKVIIEERVKECLPLYKTTIEKSQDDDKIQKVLDMHFLGIDEDAWYRLQHIPEMLKQVKAKLYETMMDIIHNMNTIKNKLNSEFVRSNNVDIMFSNGTCAVILYKLENLLDPYQRQRIQYLNDVIKKKNGRMIVGILNDTPQHTKLAGIDCYHGNTFLEMIFPFKGVLEFILTCIMASIEQLIEPAEPIYEIMDPQYPTFEQFNDFSKPVYEDLSQFKPCRFNTKPTPSVHSSDDYVPYNPKKFQPKQQYDQEQHLHHLQHPRQQQDQYHPKPHYKGNNYNPNYRGRGKPRNNNRQQNHQNYEN